MVDRLHGVEFLCIFFRGIVDLRVLHHKSFPPSHDSAAQNKKAPSAQCVSEKRHPEPDYFQCAGDIFEVKGGYL